jgi:hypothetical protein
MGMDSRLLLVGLLLLSFNSSFAAEVSTSQSPSSSQSAAGNSDWSGSLGFGVGVSQILSSSNTTKEGYISNSSFQMNLNFGLERMIYNSTIGIESGLDISSQDMSSPDGSALSVRYLTIPALVRVHLLPAFSMGIGGFAAFPINEEYQPDDARLAGVDMGFAASLRLTLPVKRGSDALSWVFEVSYERGLMQLSDSSNQLRNYMGIAGIAAHL